MLQVMSMMKSLQNAGTFIQLGASDDHAGGGHTARTSAQDQREAHYELIPDHLDGYRQALKADMDEYGKLSEAGLQLCLQRRPHLAAILRLVSQAWERLQAVNGGIDQLLNDAGMPVDSALAIEDLQAEVKKTFEEMGYTTYGGTDAPYVFVDLKGKSSWDMFSKILEEAQVVTIPGAGFGPGGEGFLRLSAFASRENCEEASERLKKMFA